MEMVNVNMESNNACKYRKFEFGNNFNFDGINIRFLF